MARLRAHSSPDAILWKKRKMGRLMKAFSKDDDREGSQPDEAQFLREAGALAARIQQELQAEAGESAPNSESSHGQTGGGRQADRNEAAASNGQAGRQLGRDVYSELDGEWARLGGSSEVEGVATDGLRIFNGPEDVPLSEDLETSPSNSNAEAIRRELMEELVQEQSRWTERHAMQVRSIEEQTRQLAQSRNWIAVNENSMSGLVNWRRRPRRKSAVGFRATGNRRKRKWIGSPLK